MKKIKLTKTSTGMEVDHIDENGLNNQRVNLRIATHSQNQTNRSKYKNNTSGFKEVLWHIRKKKWEARIVVNGKYLYLGAFNSKVKAYETYIVACKKYHGNFAKF